MTSRRHEAVAWMGILSLIVSGPVLVPWLAARAGGAVTPHLTAVPDPLLRGVGIELKAPVPPPPGCDQLTQATAELGRGRALAEGLCPAVYDISAAQQRAVDMGVPRGLIAESVHADCSVRVAKITHRDCWVVVVRPPTLKHPGYTLDPTPDANLAPCRSCFLPLTGTDLLFIDARTDRPLATVRLMSPPRQNPSPRRPDG